MRRAYWLAVLVVITACSKDHASADAPVDNPLPIDAPPDSPGTTQQGLGQNCTWTGMIEQSNCPTGFDCLRINGGSGGGFCTKTCMQVSPDPCQAGYTGVGTALCRWQIMDGTTTQDFCALICQDLSANHTICSPQVCDGTCPNGLVCKLPPAGTGSLKFCY